MTKLVVGQTLYEISREDDGKPIVEIWIVRTIRAGKITAIWKLPSTWGKRSNKVGDYGWSKNIPHWCRKTWRIVDMKTRSGPFAYSLFTTKRAAIADELRNTIPDDFDDEKQYERFMTGLKRMKP